jgi:hypothetical protein
MSILVHHILKNLVACSTHAGHMRAKQKVSLSRIANLAKGLPWLLESQKWRKCDIGHKQAAWAAWKYCGHHILETLMDNLEKAQLI